MRPCLSLLISFGAPGSLHDSAPFMWHRTEAPLRLCCPRRVAGIFFPWAKPLVVIFSCCKPPFTKVRGFYFLATSQIKRSTTECPSWLHCMAMLASCMKEGMDWSFQATTLCLFSQAWKSMENHPWIYQIRLNLLFVNPSLLPFPFKKLLYLVRAATFTWIYPQTDLHTRCLLTLIPSAFLCICLEHVENLGRLVMWVSVPIVPTSSLGDIVMRGCHMHGIILYFLCFTCVDS